MSKYKEAPTASKVERLEARVTRELKSKIELAAQLSGRSMTDFVVASVQRQADDVIREHNIITLTVQDSLTFTTALLNPREPNTALRDAFARHAAEVIDRD
jgi:uncharacterized protein (DUF1778 family)